MKHLLFLPRLVETIVVGAINIAFAIVVVLTYCVTAFFVELLEPIIDAKLTGAMKLLWPFKAVATLCYWPLGLTAHCAAEYGLARGLDGLISRRLS